MPKSFDPLDYSALSRSIVNEAMSAEPVALADVEPFYGNGVYALFYTGSHPAYSPLAEQNKKCHASFPIYVGKAAPSTRKGAIFDSEAINAPKAGNMLYKRIAADHRKSIEQAVNLDVSDFTCRILVLNPIWVMLAETSLIARYTPVWNSLLDGFGNHDPGAGRRQGKISRWDVLHPGRGREECASSDYSAEELSAEVKRYLVERTGGFTAL